jgi:phage baseplate assembly protein gpV
MKTINNFAGLNGFVWWMGVVENRMDPLKLGRCQVRIFGWHTENKQLVPSADLPWALPMISSNTHESFCAPREGDYVIGFFADSESGHFPILMGVLPGIPIESAKPGIGFYDPRTTEQTQTAPQPYGGTSSSYPNRLNEPTTSRIYRNENVDSTVIGRENSTLTTGVETASGDTWSQPKSSYNAVTPYDMVLETESGHVMEFDDTKGAERIHVAHRTGTFFEIHPDGSKVTKVVGKNYKIIAGDDFINVQGTCNITVGGDVNLMAGGKVIAKASEFDLTGPVNITGDVNVSGGIIASGDVKAGGTSGISLQGHTHSGVQSGGSSTGTPQ